MRALAPPLRVVTPGSVLLPARDIGFMGLVENGSGKADDCVVLGAERGFRRAPALRRVLRTQPCFPLIVHAAEKENMSSRMGGQLGGLGLHCFGLCFLFGFIFVFGCLLSSQAWLNAFSRMSALRVLFCNRWWNPWAG